MLTPDVSLTYNKAAVTGIEPVDPLVRKNAEFRVCRQALRQRPVATPIRQCVYRFHHTAIIWRKVEESNPYHIAAIPRISSPLAHHRTAPSKYFLWSIQSINILNNALFNLRRMRVLMNKTIWMTHLSMNVNIYWWSVWFIKERSHYHCPNKTFTVLLFKRKQFMV